MKKLVSLLLVLTVLAGISASAAPAEPDLTAYSVANGVVTSSVFDDITAPFSGTLSFFDLEPGDTVQPGDTIFSMLTTPVSAPEDGTIRYLFAKEGESADAAMSTYGAVVALQPLRRQRLSCTYSGAADYDDCRHLHIGDILGVVIATRDGAYDVEVLTGEYDAGKQLDLFKDNYYAYDNKVGSGKVILREDLTIAGSGMIAEMMVSPGDAVKKGDTLFTLMGQDASFGASPEVKATVEGVVASVPVASGQQVWKGQLLARIYHTDSLEIVAEVDEMDLKDLKVDDTVPITLDTDEAHILSGTVTEISSLGTQRQNAAYYTVHVTVQQPGMMLGQSASVYLP